MLWLSADDGGVKAGERDRLIIVQRATAVADDYTDAATFTWADLQPAWARVRFGRADEKRQAASEGGEQSASFEMVPTAALLGARITDRIVFDGSNWDIVEVAPLDRQTLRFTATRKV